MEWVVEVHTHNSIVELNCMPARLKVEDNKKPIELLN